MGKRLVVLVLMLLIWQTNTVQAVSSSYAVIDGEYGRLLDGQNPHSQLPIASLTKMWTAYVVLLHGELSDPVTISEQAVQSEGSSIYLQAGDTWTVEHLLYGLMLRSGNDAAAALAEHVGGSVDGFVYLMNEEAARHGLMNTRFTNPSGLHDDAHLSTAYDTAKMLQIAMQQDDFRRIASTKLYKNEIAWQNKHRLLHEDSGFIAGKTGFTKRAGRTLASFFEREQKQVVIVTLNEPNDWNAHRFLANKIDTTYDDVEVAAKGNYTVGEVKLVLREPITLLLKREEVAQIQHAALISRVPTSTRAVWNVLLNGERIAIRQVEKQ